MTYTVSQFDTMNSIAQKFDVPINQLMSYNNLTPNSFLFPGMIIIIPPVAPFPPNNPNPPRYRIYVVRRGDTIWNIANRFGVSVQYIMSVNNMIFPIVFLGQRLIIPIRNRPQ